MIEQMFDTSPAQKENIMATKNAAAVLDETTETAEPPLQQIVNEGIVRVIEATGIDVQKNRYKAMRAIAFQAFTEAIDAGDFDGLVERAIANVDDLPSGWEIEKPAPKRAAKATTAKATTRRRPTR